VAFTSGSKPILQRADLAFVLQPQTSAPRFQKSFGLTPQFFLPLDLARLQFP
jgi:hypothetical protein